MLTLTIPTQESFDEKTSRFITNAAVVLELEHSLVSLSKWEAEFEKSFLETKDKTPEEILAYIKHMTLTPNVEPSVYNNLTETNTRDISEYVGRRMSATWFKPQTGGKTATSSTIITAEVIYYWMIAHNIPTEYENWHLERLMTLIRVVNEMNKPPKKMSRRESMAQHRNLNAQRRQASNGG